MAVLPTPASPIRQGLFLVRLERTCITLNISSSRPITGSSFPERASFVRSRLYFSRILYLDSACGVVTRWPPRNSFMALWTRSGFTPASDSIRATFVFRSDKIERKMCSVDINSSLRLLASSFAKSIMRLTRGVINTWPAPPPYTAALGLALRTSSRRCFISSSSTFNIPKI